MLEVEEQRAVVEDQVEECRAVVQVEERRAAMEKEQH